MCSGISVLKRVELVGNVQGKMAAAPGLFVVLSLLISLASSQAVVRAKGPVAIQSRIQQLLAQARLVRADLVAETNHEKWLQARVSLPNFKPTHSDHLELVAAIKANWADVARLDGLLKETTQERRIVHRRAASLVPKIAALKASVRRQRANVQASIIQLYDMSRISPLEQVLEAKTLSDYLAQQSLVGQIGADDVAILTRARLQRAKVLGDERSYAVMGRELRALIRQDKVQRDLFGISTRHLTALLTEVRRIDARLARAARKRRAAAAKLAAGPNKGLTPPGQGAPGTWSTYLVTAYCLTGLTASGAWTRPGTMAATLPFGTRLYVPGYGSGIVQDRGGAIGPGHVDLYMASCSAALQWGARVIPIEVLG